MDIWTILGIEATNDIAVIKKAYARRAAQCHPEDDPKGFQALHEAYVEAMEIAKAKSRWRSKSEEEKPAPKPIAFRVAPEHLRTLGGTEPADEEGVPKNIAENAGGYQFPKKSPTPAPAPDEAPPKEQPEGAGGYRFYKGGAAELPLPDGETPAGASSGNAGGYQFPAGNATSAPTPEEMPPAEHPEGAGGYRFYKGGAAEMPPPEENTPPGGSPRSTGGYQFPTGNAASVQSPEAIPPQEHPEGTGGYRFYTGGAAEMPPPDENTPPGGSSESAGGYRFPKGGGSNVPQPPGSADPGRIVVGNVADSALIFPGFRPLEGFADAGGSFMPFMPLLAESAQEYFPQTKQEAERLRLLESARKQCLEDMRTFLEQNAAEEAWYPMLLGVDFTLVQYDPKFLLESLELCRKQLTREMASALYMAYGFASDKALRKYPVTTGLHAVLNQFLQLPQCAIPFLTLSENLHRSDMVLAGIARLSAECDEPYVSGQALQSPVFVHVKHQPYFLHKLTESLQGNGCTDVWRRALAQAFQFRDTPASPCLRILAEQLPIVAKASTQAEYNPAADDLLMDDTALNAFHAAIRESVLDMLEKTRKGFPQSSRRGPWDYVFIRPEFALVRGDWAFLTELLSFVWEKSLPVGIWPALADAYAVELGQLPQNEGVIPEPGSDIPSEERAKACLLLLRDTLNTREATPPKNPTFMEIIRSMLRSV